MIERHSRRPTTQHRAHISVDRDATIALSDRSANASRISRRRRKQAQAERLRWGCQAVGYLVASKAKCSPPVPRTPAFVAAQAEVRHLRDMVAALRQDRDAWRDPSRAPAGKLTP